MPASVPVRAGLTGVLALAIMLAAAAAIAAADNEQLLVVEPDGWHEVYAGREENLSTTEYVPAGQDADDWSEMFTVQVVIGLAEAEPEDVLARISAHMSRECPGFAARPIALGGTAGEYPTLAVMLMCGREANDARGEFSLLRGIAGRENFYLLRRTWRTPPYDTADGPPVDLETRRFWLGFLAFMEVCDTSAGTCPKDRADADPDAAQH